MTTQFIVRLDEKIKKTAQARAKREGIALSDVVQLAVRSFAEGQTRVKLVEESKAQLARHQWEIEDTRKAIQSYLRAKKNGTLRPLKSLADLD